MASYGRVVGGSFMHSIISINRNGDLALSGSGFRKKMPSLTGQFVSGWEEVVVERRGAIGAVSKVGQAVSLAALRGPAGKAAAAAVGSTADLVGRKHTVRVAWHSGEQSVIEIPDKQFQHLVLMLGHLQVEPELSPAASSAADDARPQQGVVSQLTQLAGNALGAAQSDPSKQIARLAALRDQGALTEEEFAAKKAELLAPAGPGVPAVPPPPQASVKSSTAIAPPPPPPVGATISTLPTSAVPPPPPPAGAVGPLSPHAATQPAVVTPPPPTGTTPPPLNPAVEPVPVLTPAPTPPPPTGTTPPPFDPAVEPVPVLTPAPTPPPPTATPPPPAAPPGWVMDPHGRHEFRYWDGSAWTDQVSSGGVQSTDSV